MGRQQGAFSAAVESWIAPVAPPPKRLASANACSRSQLADGTESVEPEGSGVGAELGNGIDHRRAGGGGRACARLGVSCGRLQQQRSSSRSSSRGGGGLKKAPLATWEAATTRAQLGSRGNRPEASWGGVERVFVDRSSACQFS